MSASETLFRRAERFLPWASSTCSKKPRLTPEEPGVIVRGKGCRVWDADGREFIDFRNALGPVSLGYCFDTVDSAIREQLDNGIIFGHPHPLEGEVAELVCANIPCAEKARFLKTGGEALSACIKLARHHTGRDHIVQIGYNGWLNSLGGGGLQLPGSVSDSVPAGIPEPISRLHHNCGWNKPEELTKLFDGFEGRIAAVVVAADYQEMALGSEFYPYLREITEKNGALLIFDEIVTGFRIALGGVQEYFGVTPDMAVFAKGIANGMPLSVYCGRADVMDCLDKAIVSSTYGGETLSLAAAKAVINIYKNEPVIEHLWRLGEKMWDGFGKLLKDNNLPATIGGMPPVSFIRFDEIVRGDFIDSFYRSIYKHGVSLYNGGYVNYSHKGDDIDEALSRIGKALKQL